MHQLSRPHHTWKRQHGDNVVEKGIQGGFNVQRDIHAKK